MSEKIPISNGELLDKFSILELKYNKILDQNKIKNIKNELSYLKNICYNIINKYNITNLYDELKQINELLWNIEDNIRIKENKQEFDNEFIELARNVYKTNDQRAHIKKLINEIFLICLSNSFFYGKLNSEIFELFINGLFKNIVNFNLENLLEIFFLVLNDKKLR